MSFRNIQELCSHFNLRIAHRPSHVSDTDLIGSLISIKSFQQWWELVGLKHAHDMKYSEACLIHGTPGKEYWLNLGRRCQKRLWCLLKQI